MKTRIIRSLICAVAFVSAAMSAHAAVQQNVQTPFVSSDFVPCANGGAGEEIRFFGIQHTLVTYTVSGSKATGLYLTSLSDSRAVGQTTGDKYIATGRIGSVLSMWLQNGNGSQTGQATIHFTGHGNAPNFDLHENYRILLSSDGSVKVIIDNVKITCR